MMRRLAMFTSIAALLVACPASPPPPPPASQSLVVDPIPTKPPAPVASEVATPPPPAPASTTCARDDECVVSTFPGCCECCECGPIRAFTRDAEAERKAACDRKKCDECPKSSPRCAPCKDPAKEGMVARCQSGACVIVETAAPRIACKTTDDCWFDDAHKPIARPPNLRGKKITPCKGGGEHAPACEAGACIVRAYKC